MCNLPFDEEGMVTMVIAIMTVATSPAAALSAAWPRRGSELVARLLLAWPCADRALRWRALPWTFRNPPTSRRCTTRQ